MGCTPTKVSSAVLTEAGQLLVASYQTNFVSVYGVELSPLLYGYDKYNSNNNSENVQENQRDNIDDNNSYSHRSVENSISDNRGINANEDISSHSIEKGLEDLKIMKVEQQQQQQQQQQQTDM